MISKFLQLLKNWLFIAPPVEIALLQPQHRAEPEFDWQYLVTPGHVIFARMNHLKFVGQRLMLALFVSFVCFYFAYISANNFMNKIDRFEKTSTSRPIIDTNKIIYGSRQFNVASDSKPTAVSELKSFITDNLVSLTNSNKLAIPCNKSASIARPWADNKGSIEYPMCNIFAASFERPARVYTYAIVNDGSQNKNWLGIFYFDKIWKYQNLGLQGFYAVSGYQSFDPSLIVNTLKSDFPDLPLLNEQPTNKQETYDND